MICEKCGKQIPDNSQFCQNCGSPVGVKTETTASETLCRSCGALIDSSSRFCPKCGQQINITADALPQITTNNNTEHNMPKSKTSISYVVSIISAAITLVIRLMFQETFYSWRNLLNNTKVVGLNSNIKPFLTAIPIIAIIVVLLNVVSDKASNAQQKIKVLIINAIFIALAFLFIWFDIPYNIIHF